MKCPACIQILKRIEVVCDEYICINPACTRAFLFSRQGYAEFYGLTQADISANYRIALAKNGRRNSQIPK